MTLSPDDYRRGMRRLAASVCVIATADDAGARNGLTATAVTSVSADPPTLLCCLNRASHTFAAVARTRRFSVNVLSLADDAVAHSFAGERAAADKFAVGVWTALATGAPVLETALAAFDCQVDQLVETGTHGVLIGAVQAVRVDAQAHGALLYADGGYGAFSAADARATLGAA